MIAFKRISVALSLTLALAVAGTVAARADDHHHDDHHGGPRPGPHGVPGPHPGLGPHGGPGFAHRGFHDFRGRDFAHFSAADRALWVGGGWHHEWHDGRLGWWWAVGSAWYFYPQPIYPYPTYVADTVWMTPEPAPAPVAGYAPGYWYYCSANGAYYPNTPTCAVPWTPVAPQQ